MTGQLEVGVSTDKLALGEVGIEFMGSEGWFSLSVFFLLRIG